MRERFTTCSAGAKSSLTRGARSYLRRHFLRYVESGSGSTFDIRFNALREERGHVFQSRYKSLVIEEGRPLLRLVKYIHLNPVRAGLVTVGELRTYQASSDPKFFQSRPPEPLRRGRFLSVLEFPDSVAGMRQYERQLEFAEESDPASRDSLAKRIVTAGRWPPRSFAGI